MMCTVKLYSSQNTKDTCVIGSKADDDAVSTRRYKIDTLEHTLKVEEYQNKKEIDSEKIGRNWRSFEAKQKPTRQ